MTTLTTAWMLGCVCGFFLGVTVAGRRRPTCRELMSERQHTFAMWREKGSDVWHPIGKDPDWADLARQQLNRITPPPHTP
jgi:hypothetical protein